MLVLSRRVHEKLVLPDLNATIEVVDIRGQTVRLRFDAPEELRVLREEVPDQLAEWSGNLGSEPGSLLGLMRLNQLLQKRLQIARRGLQELRRQVETGSTDDVETVLQRVDEDLALLQARVQHETALEQSC